MKTFFKYDKLKIVKREIRMAKKNTFDKNLIKTREKIYKEITKSPKDLSALKSLMLSQKVVESENKFDRAFEMLKSSKRIIVNGGYVMARSSDIKQGVFYARGDNRYVVLKGENRRYAISLEDSDGYFSNESVNIAFSDDGFLFSPFIVSKLESSEPSILQDVPKLDDNTVYGRVIKVSHDKLIFISKNKKYSTGIEILNPKNTLSQFQDKICVMRLEGEDKNGQPCGFITEIKGDAGNPIHEFEAIAESHGAIMSWSDDKVLREIKKLPNEVDLSGKKLVDENGNILQEGKEKIVDLRGLGFTTVDPANCRDMDDAIYSTFDENGRIIAYTAVANVSKYVDLNSEIGKRYIKGGFTVYSPNRAYNILPPELSTGICSLNPNEDRLALVIKSVIDEETGLPISSTILDAVINSKQKYSYQQAQEICDKNQISFKQLKDKSENGHLTLDEQVVLNEKVSQILWKGFNKRNFINFETKNEYDVIFNNDMSEIEDIEQQENCAYHKVIEAFMLTANEVSARFAKAHNLPNIYRVHDKPNEDKVAQTFEFFEILGVPFDGDLSPLGITKIVESVKGTNKEKAVNNFLVRLQSRAKYSISTLPNSAELLKLEGSKQHKNKAVAGKKKHQSSNQNNVSEGDMISHFGLQSKAYSHTTSPIRRISDFVTHKNILAYLHNEKYLNERLVAEIAGWANQRQNIVKKAEREFNEVSSVIYCEKHVGDIMTGYVSGFKKTVVFDENDRRIETFCVIVENEDKGLKVLIPASELLPQGIKNIALSKYRSAIINKNSHAPLIKLCEDVTFKLMSADRVTRIVTASTDLEKKLEMQEEQEKE